MNDPLPGPPSPWSASEMPRFRSRPPYLMTEMIAAEPALAQRLVRRLVKQDAVGALADALQQAYAKGRPVAVTGCGTSQHAAMAIAELLTDALGSTPGREVRAVEALPLVRRALATGVLIGISHEGGTTATNAAMEAARAAGASTALITVGAESPGAALADHVVTTDEQDQSWCHTVGYLSPIVAGVVLASRIGGSRLDGAAIHALLDVAHEPRAAADVAAGLASVDRLIIAGAGPDYVSAREMALKISEGARLPAFAMELETVLHGHLAAATRWSGLVAIGTDAAVEGMAGARLRRVLEAARALSMPAAALLDESVAPGIERELTPAGRIVLPRTGRVRGMAAALLAPLIPLQLVAERLARARGVDPDTLGREDAAQAAAHS
ncbi:MAG TPA: SIS domain-containing protein [Candidatus Limnocylindria bacterium]|nr:SIS domain-containing protein [Candidatus Limnocylindria bacterium]